MSSLSVGFVSLGCAKNLVDSEHMATVLNAARIRLAPSPEEADIVLINTCGFIGDAKRESIDAILRACALKAAGTCRAVVVAGCLTQRYQEELRRALPEVDAFIGLDQLDDIAAIVERLEQGETGIARVSRTSQRLFNPLPSRLVLTGGPFAFVKIAEGCNHRCAFCAIPGIRGHYRSRRPADIIRETETLLARGIREVNLISQDTTRYGADLGGGASLPKLLRELGRIGGRFWIRLLYGHPAHLGEDLLEAMAEVPQVCRYLDVPIQHAHPAILRAMRREGRERAVRAFPERARRLLPGVTLRTTCLVGFPGETAAQYADLLSFIRDVEFDHLGVFVFSPEEHTAAAGMPRQVPQAVARRRRDRLMREQQAIVFRKAAARKGTDDTILLLKPDRRGAWIGRSSAQAPDVDGTVRVTGVADGRSGAWIEARYIGASGYDLRARALGPSRLTAGAASLHTGSGLPRRAG